LFVVCFRSCAGVDAPGTAAGVVAGQQRLRPATGEDGGACCRPRRRSASFVTALCVAYWSTRGGERVCVCVCAFVHVCACVFVF
jgi:hypothetical protein